MTCVNIELKSGVGRAMEAFICLIEAVENLGGSDEDIRRIKTDESLRLQIARLLVSDRVVSARYSVTVNYGIPLAAMIAGGRFDKKNSDITAQNFPIHGSGMSSIEITLFYFMCVMNTDAVLAEMDRCGYRPAALPELLALGAAQPELQRRFPIIALGSVWDHRDDNRDVVFLDGNYARRSLNLRWYEGCWDNFCRFAAVRKSA